MTHTHTHMLTRTETSTTIYLISLTVKDSDELKSKKHKLALQNYLILDSTVNNLSLLVLIFCLIQAML